MREAFLKLLNTMKTQDLDHVVPVSNIANDINLDELEQELRTSLDEELGKLEFLHNESSKIGSPEELGNTIKNVVWEQFLNQIGRVAGEDFVKENRGLHFDPRVSAHTQTTEDFAQGKINQRNTIIDYQQRYDDWQKNFKFDENGNIITRYDNRSGKDLAVLTETARKSFDKDRPKGKNGLQIDHIVSAAENIRDPQLNAHVTKEEQIKYVNSETNLNAMDAEANQSKKDSSMTDWLNSTRDGKTPDERFNINKEELLEKDKTSRKLKNEVVENGEKQSLEAAQKSAMDETIRMGEQALRAALMALIADLVRKIIQKLIKWFKTANKTIKTLIESIKEAVKSFIHDLKNNILTSFDIALSAVVNAIIGPIASVIRSAVKMLQQGWNSLKEAFDYLTDPNNKEKPIDILIMEVGKIIIAGSTAVGAIALSEIIEKALLSVPGFGINIPLLGSFANIIGIFMGAVVSGILGAIALNWIDQAIAESKRREYRGQIINQGNVIMAKQETLIATDVVGIAVQKAKTNHDITYRHDMLEEVISANNPIENEITDKNHQQNDDMLSDIFNKLNS